jgi:hypothetical protein
MNKQAGKVCRKKRIKEKEPEKVQTERETDIYTLKGRNHIQMLLVNTHSYHRDTTYTNGQPISHIPLITTTDMILSIIH